MREIAEEIATACKDGEIANSDALSERIDETCDSSAWVIYTASAQQVLRYSDNGSAGIDELGADSFDWSGGIPWSQLAYFTLRRDIYDQLPAEDIDPYANDFGLEDDDTEGGE